MGATVRTVLLAAGLLAVAAAAAAPAALAARPDTTGKTFQDSAHFRVHYDPSEENVSDGYVAELLDRMEVSYDHLVAGAGGTPNAGMRPPIPDDAAIDPPPRDADGRTDFYLEPPRGEANGRAGTDRNHPYASYALVSSELEDLDHTWEVATHEFFHVLQNAYANWERDGEGSGPGFGTNGMLSESTAEWAEAFVVPQIPRGLIFPPRMRVPLDCLYVEWDGRSCGAGYDRWSFFQHLSERYGPTFVRGAYEQLAVRCPPRCDDWSGDDTPHVESVDAEIRERSGGAADLSTAYRDYALELWDPDAWETEMVADAFGRGASPAADRFQLGGPNGDSESAGQRVEVDHLSGRFAIVGAIDWPATGDGGELEISVTAPRAVARPELLVGNWSGEDPGPRERIPMDGPRDPDGGASTYRTTLRLDGGEPIEVLVPMINETGRDDLDFSWSAALRDGEPSMAQPVTEPPPTPRLPQLALRPPRGRVWPARLGTVVRCRVGGCAARVTGSAVVRLAPRRAARRGRGRGARRRPTTLRIPLRPRRLRLEAGQARWVPLRFKRHRRNVRRLTRLLRRGKPAWAVVHSLARNRWGSDRARRAIRLLPPPRHRRRGRRTGARGG